MAHFVNNCTLGGYICRPPVLTFYPDGSQCLFGLAVNSRRGGSKDEGGSTTFVNITAQGKLGEYVQKYLPVGSAIIVEGYLRQRRWTNADRLPRTALHIIARQIHSLTFGSAKEAAKRNVRRPAGEEEEPPDAVEDPS